MRFIPREKPDGEGRRHLREEGKSPIPEGWPRTGATENFQETGKGGKAPVPGAGTDSMVAPGRRPGSATSRMVSPVDEALYSSMPQWE